MESVPLPPLHVVDRDGRRLRVVPASDSDTIGDLSRALTGVAMPILVDGRWHPPGLRLTGCAELVDGAMIVPRPGADPPVGDGGADSLSPHSPPPHSPPQEASPHREVVVTVVAGPACDRPVVLAPGRHGIGRAAAMSVRVDDPDVEIHHAFLDIAGDGRLTLTQLTGRRAIAVDDEPIAGSAAVRPGATVRIGSSCLVVDVVGSSAEADRASTRWQHGGAVRPSRRHPWRRELHRCAQEHPPVAHEPIPVPAPVGAHPRPPVTALIGAGCGVLGAALIAAVLGQLLFAVVALVAASGSFLTWLVGVVAAARRRGRERRRYAADVTVFRARLARAADEARLHRRRATPELGRVLAQRSLDHRETWARRIADGTISALLGRGDVAVAPPIAADEARLELELQRDLDRSARLGGLPVPVTISSGESVAVVGPTDHTDAVCRSLVIQLATWYGPADLSIVVVARRPERWAWARWLPHVEHPHGCAVVPSDDEHGLEQELDAIGSSGDRFPLVVVDDPDALRSRTGPLRRHLDRTGAASLAVCGGETVAPALCTRVLDVWATGTAQWRGVVPEDDRCTDLRPAGCSEAVATTAARRLASLLDPEQADAAERAIPDRVALGELEPSMGDDDPASLIRRRWQAGGRDPAPRVAIGRSADGVVEIDLARDGPHGLVAGTTGAGKSELLRTLVAGLAAAVSPEHLGFVLVDYKGGATFDRCVELPHTVGLVTDLDDGLAERALVSLESELRRREHAFREVGAADLAAYRAAGPVEPLARLVIVVDEFAVLAREVPDFLGALVDVARRGRSLGVHLLLATQRPAGVVDDDVRANTNLRLALRLADAADARDVIGDDAPARFRRDVPGRAALRLGADEPLVFQTVFSSGATATDRRGPLRVEVLDPRSDSPIEAASPCSRPGSPRRDRPVAANPSETDLAARPSELDRLVSAVCEAAAQGGVTGPRPPWTAPLPRRVDPADLASALDEIERDPAEPHDAVGLVDDPRRQRRHLLRWVADGNLVLVGAARTGRTSTLLSLATARCRVLPPARCHLYVLDATADDRYDALAGVAQCAAVVRLHERERLYRVVRRLADEIDRRAATPGPHPHVLLVIDGIGALRSAWSSIEDAALLSLLDRVLADGPKADIVTVCAADAASPAAVTVPAGERWFFHLGDQPQPVGSGVPPVAHRVPGRLRIASSGLEAQVAVGADGLAALPDGPVAERPPPVACLPASVLLAELDDRPVASGAAPDAAALAVGRSFADLTTAIIDVPAGDHLLVAGTARTGVSTTLATLVHAWVELHPDGRVLRADRTGPRLPRPESPAGDDAPLLVVVDDAHRIDDGGELLAAIRGERGAVTVVAGGRYDALRAAYGHWTKELARSRCGVILTSNGDIDGDLLGVTLPRRSPIPPRPGLGWVVDGGGPRLAQVARPGPAGPSGASAVAGPERIRSER